MGAPRILGIMGSGETAPTMARVHRALFERLGAGPVAAVVLDTPYGFQENADELSRRTVEFFAASVGRPVTVATLRSRDVDAITLATAVGRIREAQYVMAGPGSPSYALRHWAGGPVPDALAAKLESGGILTMASAAALTVGVVTIPVYEVYKVGEAPRWLDGLDLLGRATGLRAAVVPHYDNAEGGTHDTRFCYMGERRLRQLEAALPDGTFILGVDGHTALVLDLDAGTASVAGLGAVTIRVAGRSTVFPTGSAVRIDVLADAARALAAGAREGAADPGGRDGAVGSEGLGAPASRGTRPHLRDAMAELEGAFIEALDRGDTRTAVGALLDLDSAIQARIRAGEDSPDLDSADATFRALIARLGERAQAGTRDPRAVLGPFVDALLEVRTRARAAGDWPTADLVRDRLTDAGVEVRDASDGSTWRLV
jgi:cyanophycinase-like exopeptidase